MSVFSAARGVARESVGMPEWNTEIADYQRRGLWTKNDWA